METSVFVLRFSWGEFWGDGGYVKLSRNKNNHCSVASYATFPIV